MHIHLKRTIKIILTALFVAIIAFAIWFMSGEGVVPPPSVTWGVTFFPQQARDLGLDWKQVYLATLDDINPSYIRLAAPWKEIEKTDNRYDFSDIDWMLEEAEKRNTRVVMAVGRKLFRWPECHDPIWMTGTPPKEYEAQAMDFLKNSVEHLKQFAIIDKWQVENEPTFPFGECHDPLPTTAFFEAEVALVRTLDTRPITTTDSGELSAWVTLGKKVDQLGVSLYRVTENPVFGKFYYPVRPGFYGKKAAITQYLNKNLQHVYLSELQLEPWSTTSLLKTTLKDQYESMSFERMQSTIAFARQTGFSEIYLWGVEWWYWLKQTQQDARYWNYARDVAHQ